MHDQNRSDRNRSRSGSRQRRGGSSNGSRGGSSRHSNSNSPRPPAPIKKQSFWQKLISIFTFKPAGASSSGRSRSSERRSSGESSDHRRFEGSSERQSRKPEVVEVTTPKLYIGNLSFDASESDLFELFNGVGKVQNAEVVCNKYTEKSKGFAFVTMLTVDEARRAVTELHDKSFMGRKLVVSGAKANDRASDDSHHRSDDRDRDNSRQEYREQDAPAAS